MSKVGALYIRVSTDKQEELSPDAQVRLAKEFAVKNDIIIMDQYIYSDIGISGRSANKRPAFQTMIATAKQKDRPFDCILLWKFSRFARSQDESAYYKSLLRKKCNVEVISITEPIIEGMYGRLMEMIIEWNDEFYSYNLAQEVKRGMEEKALRGGYQSIPPYGYDYAGKNIPPVPDPSTSKIVQSIFQKFLSGDTALQITRWMNECGLRTRRGNLWDARDIKYILSNPFYVGKIRWNYSGRNRMVKDSSEWIIADGTHKPLISQSDFDLAHEKLERLRRLTPRRDFSANKHWLSGILMCSECGGSLSYQASSRWPYFHCWKHSKGLCNVGNSVSMHKAEEDILFILQDMVSLKKVQYELVVDSSTGPDLNIIQSELDKLELKENRIKEAYRNGIDTLDEYAANKKIIEKERVLLQKKLKSAIPKPTTNKKTDNLMIKKLSDVLKVLNSDVDYLTKAKAIRSVCGKIIFNKAANTYDIHCVLHV